MNQMHFQAPTLTKINKIIIIIGAICFVGGSILKAVGAFSLVSLLGLTTDGLFHGFVFKLITYPFVDLNLMSFVFNSLILWFIGSEFETQWGRKIYLRFLLLTVIGVGLIFSLVNFIFFNGTSVYYLPLYGFSGINFALLIAYAVLYPDRPMSFMMIFPMKARTFCWILVFIEAYMAIFGSLQTSWAHLLAMGISYGIIRFQTNPIIKKVLHSSFRDKKKKGHLYVVKDEEQKPPKYWH